MNIITKTLWAFFYITVWFFAFVLVDVAYDMGGFVYILYLLGIYWGLYLAGLWFESKKLENIAWTMLLGFAIGMLRLSDRFPAINNPENVAWLKRIHHSFIGEKVIGILGLLFIAIFVVVLPLVASGMIKAHKAKNRVLGRD